MKTETMTASAFKIGLLLALAIGICSVAKAYAADPASPPAQMGADKNETIVLAGGCFWGVEAVFEHTKGVEEVVSGYAGGKAESARYDLIGRGDTGHAEVVKVTYDPNQISLARLLDIYFNVAHNPTELNFQGPDHGTQYRSAVFYATPEQQKAVTAKIAELEAGQVFSAPVVTTLEPLEVFYPAEEYHQNYMARNPRQPYILIHDAPKLKNLQKTYPEIYQE